MTGISGSAEHDDGIRILPGAVVVDMDLVDLPALDVDKLRDAFSEAEAQAAEEDLDPREVYGDLDNHPL